MSLPTMAEQLAAYHRAAMTDIPLGTRNRIQKQTAEDNRRSIVDELRRGPMTRAEIISATGLCDVSVDRHCAILAERGIIRRQSGRRGKWQLRAA